MTMNKMDKEVLATLAVNAARRFPDIHKDTMAAIAVMEYDAIINAGLLSHAHYYTVNRNFYDISSDGSTEEEIKEAIGEGILEAIREIQSFMKKNGLE